MLAVPFNSIKLGYAFDPNFKKDTSDLSKADNSYNAMVAGMDDVEYKTGPDSSQKAPVDEVSRVEMYLARIAARTGVWPTEEIDAREKEWDFHNLCLMIL